MRFSVETTRGPYVIPATALFCVFLALDPALPSPVQPVPDLILHSGKILTVDPRFAIVEALAAFDGRILAVGENQEIQRLAGVGTRLIDLEGRTVIPGLIDSHSHPTSYGMRLFRPDLSQATSLEEILEILRNKVSATPAGTWISNSGFWNESKLEEKRNPNRFDLDSVAPEHPVYLNRGHLGVVNTAAMKLLGITKKSPDPPGGTIERDPQTGEPTGRLYEAALDPVREAIPPPSHEELMEAQRHALREFAAAGVTTIRSAATSPEEARAFIDLRNRGLLTSRLNLAIRLDPNRPKHELEEFFRKTPVASWRGDPWLSIWGVKMVADGGSDLAYLRKDYANRPGFRGQIGGTRESFIRAARLCRQYGWRVGIHALGDAAIDFVLDVYEAVDRELPLTGQRWSIEHGYFLQPEHFPRIARLGLVLHPQTWHFYNLRRNFLENYGRDYADRSHPYRAILDQGIPMAGGMDWRVEPSDPFFYIWVELTRSTLDGDIVGAEHRLSREEALRFHTLWAAYSNFAEDQKGSLEAGKLADLVVLSDDYLSAPEEDVKNITPLLTMVGGKVVFARDDFAHLSD